MTMMLLVAAPTAAQTFPERGREPVVDQADLLRPEQELDIKSKSEALFAQTGRPFVVATVKSLEGRSIEDYGYRLGRHWKLGDVKRDDGVILLVAPNERKVRIETGYGARVFLTDAISSLIINQHILPRFKAGDMPGGIMAGADQVIKTMSLPADQAARNAAQAQAQAQREQEQRKVAGHGIGGVPIFFIAMLFFFVVLPMMRAAGGRRHRYHPRRRGGIDPFVVLWGLNELNRSSRGGSGWGGGGFGGGGGGFGGGGFGGGGGSFGGGGASGGW